MSEVQCDPDLTSREAAAHEGHSLILTEVEDAWHADKEAAIDKPEVVVEWLSAVM